MTPNLIIWFAGAVFACSMLLAMMHRRQAELTGILKEYVQAKLDWARKKAKTARLTRIAARDAEQKEQEAARTTSIEVPDVPAAIPPAEVAVSEATEATEEQPV